MQFSRNRFTKWLLIIAGVLLVAGSGFYVYVNKFSADSVSVKGLFANMQEKPDPNDPSLIRLPAKYSKADIQSTLNKTISTSNSLRGTNQEIANYVSVRELEVAKNTPLITDSDGRKIGDIVFKIADSNGNIIYPQYPKNQTSAIAIADNFVFDENVPVVARDTILAAYPEIENIYGPRSNSVPIKVHYTLEEIRPFYSSYSNSIQLSVSYLIDHSTEIHELVHAFHGPYVLNGPGEILWEEGMTVKVTQLIVEKLGISSGQISSNLIRSGYELSKMVDNPSVEDVYLNDTFNTNKPYAYGSALIDSLYASNSEFFKKFNSSIYALNPSQINTAAILSISAQSTVKVAGEDTLSWLGHKYGLISLINDSKNPKPQMFYFSYDFDTSNQMNLNLMTNYRLDTANDFSVRVLDSNGGVLVDNSQCSTTNKFPYYLSKLCSGISQRALDYDGVIKIEAKQTLGHAGSGPPVTLASKTESFIKLKSDSFKKYKILDLAGAGYAKITNTKTGEAKVLKKINGYFSSDDAWFGEAGNYRIEEYRALTSCGQSDISNCANNLSGKVTEKFYYRPDSKTVSQWTETVPIATNKFCAGKINSTTIKNRSAEFKLSAGPVLSSDYFNGCGILLSLNNVPLARYWGKNLDYSIMSLLKNTNYNYQIGFQEEWSGLKTFKGVFKTTDALDFSIVSQESIGNPADNTFRRRITLNLPYNKSTINLKLRLADEMTSPQIETDIIEISDKIFEIKPKTQIYNNETYSIIGLSAMRNNIGDPIYQPVLSDETFSTGLNPIGGTVPAFSLIDNTLAIGEKPVVSANFNLANFTSAYQNTKISSCSLPMPGQNCILFTIQVNGSTVTLVPPAPLAVKSYHLTLPATVDGKNNYVPAYSFNFSVTN